MNENEINLLIDDYKRKIETINQMLKETDRIKYPITYTRIETKRSCYRTFLSELEKLI
jgi:hypothetical protein